MAAVWRVIVWAANSLAHGRYPEYRHDDSELGSFEEGRKFDTTFMPNEGLPMHGAVCQFRADLAEMTKGLGFKSVTSRQPCMLCDAVYGNMFDLPASLRSPTTWSLTDQRTYHNRLAEAIVTIKANRSDHKLICESLEYDMRRKGPGGRRLMKQLKGLGPDKRHSLPKGARLVLHGEITTFESIDNITKFPVTLMFFFERGPIYQFCLPTVLHHRI